MKFKQNKLNIFRIKLFDLEKIQDTEKLLKYRQRMLWIVQLCILGTVGMASGAALALSFGAHTAELILLLVSGMISVITFIPAVICFVCIDEIEKILIKRQIKLNSTIDRHIRSWALKFMFWFALIVLLPILIRKLTS